MARHNKLCDGVADLVSKSFTSTHVYDESKIYTVRAVHGGKDTLKGSPLKDKGDLNGGLLIRDLWTQGTDSINDMHVMNTDATSYQYKIPKKFLKTYEKGNNKKYLDACLKNHRHFTPFVASVEILLGVEAEAMLKYIVRRLATKWNEPYSCTCRYVKIKFSITLIRAMHCYIRGGRVLV